MRLAIKSDGCKHRPFIHKVNSKQQDDGHISGMRRRAGSTVNDSMGSSTWYYSIKSDTMITLCACRNINIIFINI